MERIGHFLSGGRLWRVREPYTLVYRAEAGPPAEGLTERVERWARRLLGL